MSNKLDKFTAAYIEAMLWSSTDEADEPLDSTYGTSDISPDAMVRIQADCQAFQTQADDCIYEDASNIQSNRYAIEELAGHDFWLTRNGHGAGFWDGDWIDPHGNALTALSKTFGECSVYVGDDGLVYVA